MDIIFNIRIKCCVRTEYSVTTLTVIAENPTYFGYYKKYILDMDIVGDVQWSSFNWYNDLV